MRPIIATFARIVLAATFAATASAHAQSKSLESVTLAGLRTIQFVTVQYALKQGYFKREGLDVHVVVLNAGPPAISAVISGSAEIGYASPVTLVFARARGEPVRMFDALTMTSSMNKMQWNSLVVSGRSGIKSIKDLRGKTIVLNALGGALELQFSEALESAGLNFDSVRKIILPFPQMQAALQLGNADAAWVPDPFRTSMIVSPGVKGIVLASGTLPNSVHRYPEDVLFVRDDWGSAHKDILRHIMSGIALGLADFQRDSSVLPRVLLDDLKLSQTIVSRIGPMQFANVQPSPADIQPIIDALNRHHMLNASVDAADTVLSVQ